MVNTPPADLKEMSLPKSEISLSSQSAAISGDFGIAAKLFVRPEFVILLSPLLPSVIHPLVLTLNSLYVTPPNVKSNPIGNPLAKPSSLFPLSIKIGSPLISEYPPLLAVKLY